MGNPTYNIYCLDDGFAFSLISVCATPIIGYLTFSKSLTPDGDKFQDTHVAPVQESPLAHSSPRLFWIQSVDGSAPSYKYVLFSTHLNKGLKGVTLNMYHVWG